MSHPRIAVLTSIFDSERRVLCLLRSETDTWMPLCWGLPGGHMDRGEYPYQAAVRETKEECNLDTQPFYCGVRQSDDGWTIYQYGAEYNGGEIKLSFEHSDYKWFTLEELKALENVTPSLFDTVQKALAELK